MRESAVHKSTDDSACRVYENCLGMRLLLGEGSPGHLDLVTDA